MNWIQAKVSLVVLTLFLIQAFPARATLLVYEGFNYGSTGKNIATTTVSAGIGLSGIYTQIGSYGPYYSTSSLSMPGIPAQGGRLETGNAGTYLATAVGAKLATTFSSVTDSVYMSYLFLINGTTSTTIQPVSVSINSSVTGNASTNLFSVQAANANGLPAISYGTVSANASTPLTFNTTYLLLARFTNVGTTLSATVPGVATLWVLTPDQFAYFQTKGGPTDSALDAAAVGTQSGRISARVTATITSGLFALNANDALQVAIQSSGADIYDRVDEIRLGTSLTDVTFQLSSSVPNLMPAAAKVLHYMNSIQGRYVIAGQFEQQNSTTASDTDQNSNLIYSITGKRPAIIGMDIGDNLPDPLENAKRLWQQGYIIQLNWHMAAPVSPLLPDGPANAKTVVTSATISNALTPGTPEYANFISKLDAGAARLQELQDAGIPVLWRPFHECNGGWFWWSMGYGNPYIKLYKFMWNYYTNTKHLNNLIWVWAESGSPLSITPSYYPGDAYVDIGGASCYHASADFTTTWGKQFTALQVVTHRPMAALAECDILPNPDLMFSSGANWVYWLDWNSNWLDQNIADGIVRDPAHLNSIYQNNKTIHVDLLPDWTAYQSRQTSRSAYTTIQAEAFNSGTDIPVELCLDSDGSGLDLGPVTTGQYISFSNVDFGSSGSTWCSARIASANSGGTIDVYLDSRSSSRVLTMSFSGTGGWQTWKTVGWNLTGITGVHDVYFVFKGGTGPLFSVNWLIFK